MNSAILGTNTLASGFVGFRKLDSTPGALIRRWRAKDFTFVVSGCFLAELERTFTDPPFTERLRAGEIRSVLVALHTDAFVPPITLEVVAVATQPKEDAIVAAAINAPAECLVTGDRYCSASPTLKTTPSTRPGTFSIASTSSHPQTRRLRRGSDGCCAEADCDRVAIHARAVRIQASIYRRRFIGSGFPTVWDMTRYGQGVGST